MTKGFRQILLYSSLALTATGFASCSKDKDDPATSKTSLLTSKSWKIESVGIDINKDGVVDQTLPIDDCSLDNTVTFHTDGTGVYNEGANVCDGEDAGDQTFNWTFKENETVLSFSIPSLIDQDGQIRILNENTLEVYTVEDAGGGITVHQVLKLKH
ncbi:lipocalin family protein [Flavihumibacter petaseus]|uniref:Lipocalin-like domain-containing protein n=1 Tax=Flavihumibacter petaseus NBRC 106054 TaxID=1220578 RepID=A0A0E9MVD0_9BACT|nr:lipocalin family protein [Flavihumibacter petaseus]GAO41717.1 hypothetical protein FPE01S_01_07310 [Flavihumibacter petaseus NBRC 106054]